jgi:hypothetical protein
VTFFDKFRSSGDKAHHPVPEDSTVMGALGNYDPRVFIRNIAYDALLGEAADEVLHEVYELAPVSEEGREALQQESEARLAKVIAALPVIEATVDTVIRIVAELNPKAREISPEIKEKAILYESDVARRCVLATLSCLADLGLIDSNLPEATMKIIKLGGDDDE